MQDDTIKVLLFLHRNMDKFRSIKIAKAYFKRIHL